MNRTHRIVCLLLAVLMAFTLAACSKGNEEKPSEQPQSQNAGSDASQAGNSENASDPAGQAAQPAKLSGKLNLIDLDDRDPSVLRGLRIAGNLAGTADGFNGKDPSLTDVRCIFELNEWVEFYPDTDKTYGLRVWILKHRDDQEYYNNAKFSDLMPNFANYCDLHYPEDVDTPDEWYWGNFYLHEEEFEPGYYDFVFTYEGKAIAVLVTRFYRVGELSGKSDADLEALMHAS